MFHYIVFQTQRAVSSPSLCDGPLDAAKCSKKPRHDENVPVDDTNSAASNTTTSVLQKFRKTFSSLTGRTSNASSSNGTMTNSNHPSNNLSASHNTDITEYRFGPLIWRTSKERRKTKHYRRDKCNSGDSGIQVENDENLSIDVIDGLDALPTTNHNNVRVKRANSAKVTSNTFASSIKPRVLKRNDEVDKLALVPGRSLSQPYGLNHIAACKIYFKKKKNFFFQL